MESVLVVKQNPLCTVVAHSLHPQHRAAQLPALRSCGTGYASAVSHGGGRGRAAKSGRVSTTRCACDACGSRQLRLVEVHEFEPELRGDLDDMRQCCQTRVVQVALLGSARLSVCETYCGGSVSYFDLMLMSSKYTNIYE